MTTAQQEGGSAGGPTVLRILLGAHLRRLRETTFLLGAPAVQVDMKKAALVSIALARFDAHPQGVLRWMLIPRLAGD